MGRWKFSIRTVLLLTLAIALGIVFVREVNRRANNYVLNPYRIESTGDMLVEFMEKHNRWPADWTELQRFVESGQSKPYGVQTFQELRDNVTIDFAFDPKSVADSTTSHNMRAVVANDGTLHGATHDPNATIFEYLKRKRRPGLSVADEGEVKY